VLLIALLLTAQATYWANQAIATQRAATACLTIFDFTELDHANYSSVRPTKVAVKADP